MKAARPFPLFAIACALTSTPAIADDGHAGEPFLESEDGAEPQIPPGPRTAPSAAFLAPPTASPTSGPAAPAHQLSPYSPEPTSDGATGAPGEFSESKVKAKRILHGFRMGYMFIMNHDAPTRSPDDASCPNCSLKEKYNLRTPHQFLIGYELMARMVGKDWLNVIMVGNVVASGLEQSRFFPSANALVGFEIDRSFQVGVGGNFTLEEDKAAHMIVAAGWTPDVGGFYVPLHAFFIPDVDNNHRTGMTVGVNW